MKNSRILPVFLLTVFLHSITANAQFQRHRDRDSLPTRKTDSSRSATDTARFRRGGLNSLFADTAKLTSSDYQLQIEKTYVLFDNIETKSELGTPIDRIQLRLNDNDSMLSVLKDNILNNSKALSLQNLQVFKSLMEDVQTKVKTSSKVLDSTEKNLEVMRRDIQILMTDTVLRALMRDSALRIEFAPQLKIMRSAFRSSARHLRTSMATINQLQTHASANYVTADQLLGKVEDLLSTATTRIFGKEFNYLWEKTPGDTASGSNADVAKAYNGERKALHYYFKGSGGARVLLLMMGFLFLFWIYRNITSIRRTNNLPALDRLGFSFLPSGYIVSALVMVLCLAPLFDLHAPSAYIEFIQFLLLIVLTIICWKKWPRKLFLYWIVLAVLYICFSLSHHIFHPGLLARIGFILLNILSIMFGLLFLSRMHEHLYIRGFLRFVIILHNVMNILAIGFNLFGRVTVAEILGTTAIYSFMQSIGLAIFSKIFIESILLQIVASKARRGVSTNVDYKPVITSFSRPILLLVVILWLMVFATNLNIYNPALAALLDFLKAPRIVGRANFTVGGVLLFFAIIWVAHLLQKYIGYFFGDTGDDEDVQNKRQRSRLLIIKLVLLCMGYLIAVAASGLPVDKITIVLGALGVGIGLGLQNIVNNFVSGIILIFDRPFQIGDIVEVNDKAGRVREIGLRSSTLLTDDGAEVIIPNGDLLSKQITNWTLSSDQRRLEFDLSVSGNTDMEQVSAAIKKAILSSKYVVASREPQILFTRVNDDGFDLKAFFWCEHVSKAERARSEVTVLLHTALLPQKMIIK